MADETATNPVEADDTQAGEPDGTEGFVTGVEQEGEDLETETDEAENPEGETEEDEEFEVDDGLKLSVPKAVAAKLKELKEGNLRQQDYTRKTQEVAEARKAVEAEREAVHQASEAEHQARARVIAIDQQLAPYWNVDWAAEMSAARANYDQDRLEYLQVEQARFSQLKDARGAAAGQFVQLQQQRTLETQQATAKRVEQAMGVLAREVEGGWDAKKQAETLEGGIREYKFERSEIESFEDPRMVLALVDALKWRAHLKSQKKVANVAAGQEVPPVQTLRGASGRTPVKASTKDFAAFEKLAAKAT